MDGALSLPVVENRIKGPMSLNFNDNSLHVALTHALIDGLSVKSTIKNLTILNQNNLPGLEFHFFCCRVL